MPSNPNWKSESKVLAIFDQALSSGMSLVVMFLVADSYSLTIIAVLSLVSNISYSFATIAKSQLLYSSLMSSRHIDDLDQSKRAIIRIPTLQLGSVSTVSFVVLFISISTVNSNKFSLQMLALFIGVLLTDYFRNALIHEGFRIISFKLNVLSAFILIFFLAVNKKSPFNLDLISIWSLLQFVFPLFILINFTIKKVEFLKRRRNEKLTGRYFFAEATFSRLTMLLGSVYVLFSNAELAGTLAIAYLIFAAFPSLIASALQPISNQLVIKQKFGKAFNSVVLITFLSHIFWCPLFLLSMHLQPDWFPDTFHSAQKWCVGTVLASMTTAFLNLYQIRMLSDLGGLNFIKLRFLAAIFTGPIGAAVAVNSNFFFYSVFCLVTFLIFNPITYRKLLASRFLFNRNGSKEN
jgi:hypothetical protein